MYIAFNCLNQYKFNIKCIHKVKFRRKCLIYKVKCKFCNIYIYIDNTQQTLNKRIYNKFSNVRHILTNVQKSDSFTSHYNQHLKYTTSCTYISKFIMFKIVKHINNIRSIKTFIKHKCSLCMEECLIIIKRLCDKHVTLMKNIYK